MNCDGFRRLANLVAWGTVSTGMTVLGGCTLPQAAPSVRNVSSAAVLEGGPVLTPLTAEIVDQTATPRASSFPASLLQVQPIDGAIIVAGDVVSVTVFESAGGDALLGSDANLRTDLGDQTVDALGRIMVPYVGPMLVAGKSIDQVRAGIVHGLARRTLDPQVVVRLGVRQGANVTVQGIVAKPGSYSLETKLTRLVDLLAVAGVTEQNDELVRVSIRRGAVTGNVRLADVVADGAQDIALRPGDKIFLSRSRDTLTVLGAAGVQGRVEITGRSFSLVDALASARGANDELADPRGVFLFRQDSSGLRQRIYQLDMRNPAQLMLASRFQVRNGDALYVSNAPFAQTKKVLTALTTSLNTARLAGTLGE
ncbi:MAG: hypothetical protein EOP89_08590 [Lysobacteraceae bacterium]|nr:MAG: hypothetical protein EOP89_08590 [Xanthomonadaceae bacterium]